MIFVFDGSIERLKELIWQKAEELQKDIIIDQPKTNVLKIGFKRLGYLDGRFFVADIIERDGIVTLSGEFVNIYENQSGSEIISLFLVYGILEIIPLIIWLLIFRLNLIVIPLIVPVPIMLFLFLKNRFKGKDDEFKEIDDEFKSFLSLIGKVRD